MKLKFNKDVALGLGITVLGAVTTVLSGVKEKSAREALKSELKDEVMKEILKEKN